MSTINDKVLIQKIEDAIEKLRPFFEADGGDIRLVEISKDYVAKVKLIGSCSACSMSNLTLKAGIEQALKEVAPEIHAVEAIEE